MANSTSPTQAVAPDAVRGASVAEIDASCRWPVMFLLLGALLWLAFGSLLGLIASIKLHAPGLLAECPGLTYGRVQPAQTNAFLYGFAIPAGLATAIWILCRLGRCTLAACGSIIVAVIFWNFGVTMGEIGIFYGKSTGFAWLELSRSSNLLLLFCYVFIAAWAVVAYHRRSQSALYPSHWFLLAAIFWFPWIYSTAIGALLCVPLRGTLQASVDWWYQGNLSFVWLGCVGTAIIYYFLPKLVERPLHSYYLAVFGFWVLIFFGSWCGIPAGAPLPAWMGAMSTAANAMLLIPLLALAINFRATAAGQSAKFSASPSLRFIGFGTASYLAAGLLGIAVAYRTIGERLRFTYFTTAITHLSTYGFYAMVIFGAIAYLVPRLVGRDWPSAGLSKLHFLGTSVGAVVYFVAMAIGGIVQGTGLNDSQVAFADVVKGTMPFVGVGTIGITLMAAGNVALLLNFLWMMAVTCPCCGEAMTRATLGKSGGGR